MARARSTSFAATPGAACARGAWQRPRTSRCCGAGLISRCRRQPRRATSCRRPGRSAFRRWAGRAARDAVRVEADLDRDGHPETIIGLPHADGGAPGSGAVIIPARPCPTAGSARGTGSASGTDGNKRRRALRPRSTVGTASQTDVLDPRVSCGMMLCRLEAALKNNTQESDSMPDQPSEIREVIRNVREEMNRFANYALVILGTEVIGVISRDTSVPIRFQGGWWIVISIGIFSYVYFSHVIRCTMELNFLSRHLETIANEASVLNDWHIYHRKSGGRDKF